MLDLQDEGGRLRLADAITQLKCEIEFPASWSDFFTEENMLEGLSAPLHPGALKYYKEADLM